METVKVYTHSVVCRPWGCWGRLLLDSWRNQAQANISISDMVKAGSEAKSNNVLPAKHRWGARGGGQKQGMEVNIHCFLGDLDLEANTSSLCALLVKAVTNTC